MILKLTVKKLNLMATIVLVLFAINGCEQPEDNKINSAQACLDNLKDTDPDPAALACENKVAGVTSAQSYVIRCSARFFLGGVRSTEIASAFDDYQKATANNRPAILMAALAQADKTKAQDTYDACIKSGVPSLIYVAGLSQAGTIMTVDGGSTDPATFLSNCEGVAGTCDDAAVGTAVLAVYSSFCTGNDKTRPECNDIASAIANSNGDPAAVALALYTLLQ